MKRINRYNEPLQNNLFKTNKKFDSFAQALGRGKYDKNVILNFTKRTNELASCVSLYAKERSSQKIQNFLSNRFRIRSGMTKIRKELINLSTYPLINFKSAFTLAEVLITLGIIGIVAAITIPGLMTTYKAHQLHSQFLKSYSTIQQVFKQMEADDVSTNPADYKSTKDTLFYKTFIKYLKAPTDCGNYYERKIISGCYDYTKNPSDYKTLDGKLSPPWYWFDGGEIMLQDGTIIIFENVNSNQLYIHVDLNGYSKKPNIWGYDLFTFHFTEGELKPMGAIGTTYTNTDTYCNKKISNTLNGVACANKAKDNTDYFKDVIKNIQ